MRSSSEEEDDDDEEEEAEESESSSEDDFDSDDERVNVIPSQPTQQSRSQAPKDLAQNESSSESDGKDDTTMVNIEQPLNSSQLQKVGTCELDSESESDAESSSDSESPTQKAFNGAVPKAGAEAMQALCTPKRKLRQVETKRSPIPNDEVTGKDTIKSMKRLKNDPACSKSAKGELLESLQGSQTVRNGHGAVVDIMSEDSVRNDRKLGASTKKRKLESLQHDAGRDSADSSPTLKKTKDAKAAMNRDIKQNTSKRNSVMSEPSAMNKASDQEKSTHDVGKELAKKTLNSMKAQENGSTVSIAMKTLATGQRIVNEPSASPKQRKLPHVWSVDEDIIFAREILNNVKIGLDIPSKALWTRLSEVLQEKVGVEVTKEQLCEKAKLLKRKYRSTLQKVEGSQVLTMPFKDKNCAEQRLFDIMSQIWGESEITNLENQQGGDYDRKQMDNSSHTPARKGKRRDLGSPEALHLAKANTGNTEKGLVVDNYVDPNFNAILTTSSTPEQGQFVQVDSRRNTHNTPDDDSGVPSNKVERLLEEKIHATLQGLQEWTKQILEEWIMKADALIEQSTKRLEDQVQRAIGTSMVGGCLPVSVGNPMEEMLLLQGKDINQKKWQELRFQELNIYTQRLELMRLECELKQEQIKSQLQGRSKQK